MEHYSSIWPALARADSPPAHCLNFNSFCKLAGGVGSPRHCYNSYKSRMSFIPSAQPGSVSRCATPFACSQKWRWLSLLLVAISLGLQAGTVTWDADTGTAGAQDGAGIWSASSPNWWTGSGNAVWNNGDNAIFGSPSGSAGTIGVISSGITVGDITFNTHPGYLLNTTNASTLTLSGTPTITANVDATLNLVVAGSGFKKEGLGVLTLNPGGNNNTFGGTTVINSGRVVLGGGTDNVIQLSGSNVVVNAGAALVYTAANPLPTSATLTLDGGALTNANATGGKLLTLNRLVLDNNAVFVGSFAQASMLVTNCDIRSGLMGLPRLQNISINNFPLVKSTTGTATIDTASQSAGSQGFIVTMQGGTLVMEYLNPGPSGDTAVRAKYGAVRSPWPVAAFGIITRLVAAVAPRAELREPPFGPGGHPW